MVPDESPKCEEVSGYSLIREKIETNLDPELQNLILTSQSGELRDRSVDVLARIKDITNALPTQLQVVKRIGDVVTGTLAVKNIVRVREHDNIQSLKGARKVHETLDDSLPEIGASRQQLRTAFSGRSIEGAGVIIGVVDRGCDFAHPNFRNKNGTRLLYLWDQRHKSPHHASPKGFTDGREFNTADINKALKLGRPDCYKFLDYSVTGRRHGTRVLDIAAGSGTDINPPGVAPGADLIFVDLAMSEQPEQPFGDSRHLLEAVNYIFEKADEIGKREGCRRSVVVNVSLSCDSGPHDGSSPFERAVDHLLQVPGRAVVIAAGNSAERSPDNYGYRTLERHAARLLQPNVPISLKWQVRNGATSDNKVDAWYDGRSELLFSLITPGGKDIGSFPLGTTTTICRDGQPVARVFHRRCDPNNGDNEIILLFTAQMETGDWTIKFNSLSRLPFTIHAWAESNDATRSGFPNSDMRDCGHTISSVACGHNSIAVGGYFSGAPHNILPDCSEGPTRDGRLKPEVSAPGARSPQSPFGGGILAANAESDISSSSSGGTSAAAPHVAGLIALLMQNAGRSLSITEIRDQVIKTARQQHGQDCAWHPRFGNGRIDTRKAILSQTHPVSLVAYGSDSKSFSAEPAASTDDRSKIDEEIKTQSISSVLATGANIQSLQKGVIAMRKRKRATTQELLVPLEELTQASLTDLGDGEEVDHTPIIITNGSVNIDFSSDEYTNIAGIFSSSGLNLHLIECLHATHSDGSRLCYFVRPNELCTIVFHTERPSSRDEPIIIQGGLHTSPTIIFSAAEYPQDTTAPSLRRVHSNPDRKFTSLEIFRTRGDITERVHVCPLASIGGRREYKIWDPHLD